MTGGDYVAILIIIILLGIFTNTIIRFSGELNLKIKKWRGKKFISNSKALNGFDYQVEEMVYLNSLNKLFICMFILSLCVVQLIGNPEKYQNNIIINIMMGLVVITILLGISLFLHNSKFRGFEKLTSYIMKICILLIFTLAALDTYIKTETSIEALVVSIAIPVSFSFLLMKSVIDSFSSYLFQVLNFIGLILVLNLFCIGYTFGIFYGINNHSYIDSEGRNIFFQTEEIKTIENTEWDVEAYLLITYEGIRPFYSLIEINTNKGILGYVPFFEFILGTIYNLTVVAFFISYSVSKLINRQESKSEVRKIESYYIGGNGI